MTPRIQDKLQKDIDRIFNTDAVSVGKAMPLIYSKVKELGGTINVLTLIDRLKKFEQVQGHIKKSDINLIVKKIMHNQNRVKDKT